MSENIFSHRKLNCVPLRSISSKAMYVSMIDCLKQIKTKKSQFICYSLVLINGAMDNYTIYTLNEDVNGSLLAISVGIVILASLIANSFVLVVTLYNIKVLRQPANIFLTNLILGNLFITIFHLPTTVTIVTGVAGEWVLGTTLEQKDGFCDFFGVVSNSNTYFETLTFTVISVDRFLFIVKPLIHKRFMNTKVAVTIAITTWIISVVLSLPAIIGVGLDFGNESSSGPSTIDNVSIEGFEMGIITGRHDAITLSNLTLKNIPGIF